MGRLLAVVTVVWDWLAGVICLCYVVSGTKQIRHPSRRHAAQFGCWRELGSHGNMQPTWSRAHSARCGQHDEPEAHRLWECEHNNTIDLPPVPPAARTLGDARTCPIRVLVPAQFLHKFPIPEDTLLFGCKEAATNDTAPRHGEHSLVAFGDGSGGRYASDTRYRRVGTAAIILDFTGAEWSDIEKLSMHSSSSTKRPPHSTTQTKTRPSTSLSPCQGAWRNLHFVGRLDAGAPWGTANDARRRVLGIHSRPHTYSQTPLALRRLFGARFGVPRKPPPFPVWATQEIMGTHRLPRHQQRLIGGSPPRGQTRHGGRRG